MELHSLRQIRLHHGWSFTRMAELIGGMSGPTLFRILDEQHRGNEISVFKIRRFLQGDPDDAGR
jgi:hypothetical protein